MSRNHGVARTAASVPANEGVLATCGIGVDAKDIMNEEAGTSTKGNAAQFSEKSSEDAAKTLVDDPEGGALGVRAILGAWAVYFCTWGFVGSWSVFQSHYVESRLSSHTASQIAWIGSIQLFMVYSSSVFTGRLYDSGWMRTILGCSCICTTFGFMMASLSTEYWHYILSQGVVLGVGLGSSFTPSVACVTSYYKKKRGLANALLSSGSAVSGLVIPIYLSKMINNPKIGLDWALRTSGFLCFVFQGLAWLVMKQKKLPPNHRPLLDFSVFRSPSYTCTVFAYMATVLGIFYPVFYIQSFARYKGVDKDTAFWSIAIFNGVSMIGRVVPPIVADWVGCHNVVVASVFSACLLAWVFPALHNWAGIAAYAGVYGIVYGSYVTLTPVVAANLSDHPSRIGTHIGMAFLVNALGAISGQPALGAVVAATGQYWQAALIAGAFLTIASVLITTSNLLFRKRMGTWRV